MGGFCVLGYVYFFILIFSFTAYFLYYYHHVNMQILLNQQSIQNKILRIDDNQFKHYYF